MAAAAEGDGVGWHEHSDDVLVGCERFFRPGYHANLVSTWLPALDGVVDKLTAGAAVVDMGCGHGASTIVMAQAFPRSSFTGSDHHAGSIATAEQCAAGDRVEGNLNPVGRAYYGFSTLLCTPASLSQDVGLALGTQAGPARIRDVVSSAGFTRFRVVASTPFNNVFEARK